MQPLVATAPGKLVLSGEYAVLLGAPALVLAVDRVARCEIAAADTPGWSFHSGGFDARSQHARERLIGDDLDARDPARVCQAILRELIAQGVSLSQFPEAVSIRMDTRAFYRGDTKLGLGSSAAVTVALTLNLLRLLRLSHLSEATHLDALAVALTAHRQLQSGRGSGLDIATAFHGHTLEFTRADPAESPACTPRSLPTGVHLGFFFTGSSSATGDHLARFDRWRANGPHAALDHLISGAHSVIDALPDADQFMRQLRVFAARLRAFDDAGDIGVYGPVHKDLAAIAGDETLYKPSGAGGGDIGIAVARSVDAIETFAEAASRRGAARLQLSTEHNGIQHS